MYALGYCLNTQMAAERSRHREQTNKQNKNKERKTDKETKQNHNRQTGD